MVVDKHRLRTSDNSHIQLLRSNQLENEEARTCIRSFCSILFSRMTFIVCSCDSCESASPKLGPPSVVIELLSLVRVEEIAGAALLLLCIILCFRSFRSRTASTIFAMRTRRSDRIKTYKSIDYNDNISFCVTT